jgi:putative spermidine/putrescine transport system substrate-binding protein
MADAPYLVAPTSTKAQFSKGLEMYAKNMGELEKMNVVNWEKLNPRRAEYIQRFNREIRV